MKGTRIPDHRASQLHERHNTIPASLLRYRRAYLRDL
jgi:hypothetical protein